MDPIKGRNHITINQALAWIEGGEYGPDGFSLKFVRSSGALIGEIAYKARVRKGAPDHYAASPGRGRGRPSKLDRPDRKRALHKDFYTLPLVDIDTDNFFTPVISHLLELDGVAIKH